MTAVEARIEAKGAAIGEQRSSRIFLLIAPLLYAAYALLTPPFQTPDEHQHLFRAWQLSELHILGERRANVAGGVLPSGLGQAALPELGTLDPHSARAVVKRPLSAAFVRSTSPYGTPHFFNFVGAVMFSPVGYVPQVGAVWIGKVEGLSVEDIVRLGRLLNAALAIMFIYASIRLTPVGALALMWVGLLPMSAAASASFGQHALVIGGACLLTAVGLRVVLHDGRWKRSEIWIAAPLACAMTVSKLLYFPIAAIAAVSFFRGEIRWRRLLVPLLVCVLALATAALWLHAIHGLIMPAQPDVPPADERLAIWLRHPGEVFGLLGRTYVGHGVRLLDTLFTFGWVNVGPVRSAAFLSLGGVALVLVAGDPAASLVGSLTRIWLLLIAASIVLLLSAALYLYWTAASANSIQGLQARYFIPIFPLVLIACTPKRQAQVQYGPLVALMMVAANFISLGAILRAFYSF